jgi:thermitase
MRLITSIATLTLVAFIFAARPLAQTAASGPAVAGQILVKFRPGASANAKADAHRVSGGAALREIARTGVQLVAVPAGNETSAIARYQRNPNVLYAERNFIRSIPRPITHAPGTDVVPGDFYFREQWALHNTGQQFFCIIPTLPNFCFYVGTPNADIDAPEAWAISTGTAVRVAVIDTGIDYTHPDLTANYAGGADFVNGDADPMDDHGHGTHVSGTIAAALNNPTGDPAEEEGVVGVAPHARILSYKVCDATGNCNDFAIEQAIAQAITDGAKVINMSLGGPDFSQSSYDAVQDAWNAGLVIVAGAGNDGTTNQFYPAAYDNVISVAAFDEDHRRPTFSTYGSWVDISAPGNVILSTYPMSACGGATTVPGDTGCYNWLTGTSMATPHVAGAAALVWSRGDVTSNQQVVAILLDSADPQGVDSVRLDSWTIHGGLNLHNALSYGLTNLAPVANAGIDQQVTDSNADGSELVTLDGSASSDADGSIISYEWREGSTVIALIANPDVWLSVGTHTLTLQVTDDDGATASDSLIVTVNPAPNQPPVANAGPDQTVTDADGNGVEAVTLTGSASSDADGTVVSYEWREGTTVVATSESPTVSFAIGTHTLTLQVTDDDGATATDTVTITVNPRPAPAAIHAGDLDGSSVTNKNQWTARVSVAVHDTNHQAVAGAVVTGLWSGGVTGAGSCTTAANGICAVTSTSIPKRAGSATFTVTGITATGLSYSSSQNHDPDGDSAGTAITVFKP